MVAYPTSMTDVFLTIGSLEKHKAIGVDGVSAQVLKISLSLIFFLLTHIIILHLSCGCIPNCPKNANLCPSQKSG